MEIAIVLALLVGVLIFALRSGNTTRKIPPTRQTASHKITKKQPPHFDAGSAKPQPSDTLLTGSAYVIDGDTLVIKKTQVRLFGVDAPEMNHPYGKKAKWALVSLCKGQTINAQLTDQDAHGRTVAKCFLQDGRDLSAEMVKQGLAIDWPKFSGGKYRSLEVPDARKKLWLADARQKGRIRFPACRAVRAASSKVLRPSGVRIARVMPEK